MYHWLKWADQMNFISEVRVEEARARKLCNNISYAFCGLLLLGAFAATNIVLLQSVLKDPLGGAGVWPSRVDLFWIGLQEHAKSMPKALNACSPGERTHVGPLLRERLKCAASCWFFTGVHAGGLRGRVETSLRDTTTGWSLSLKEMPRTSRIKQSE